MPYAAHCFPALESVSIAAKRLDGRSPISATNCWAFVEAYEGDYIITDNAANMQKSQVMWMMMMMMMEMPLMLRTCRRMGTYEWPRWGRGSSSLTDRCSWRNKLVHPSVRSLCVPTARSAVMCVFSERERSRSLFAVALPSVCLSSVTFVRPTQSVQIFGNISTALVTLAIHWHPLKIS